MLMHFYDFPETVINPISFEVKIDGQTSDSWEKIIASFSDANIYQSWAYGSVRWGNRSLSHIVLQSNNIVVAAAQLMIIRLPFISGGIAYLRWGPLCHAQGTTFNPFIPAAMLAQLRREYVEKRKLTLQIIPNAFVGTNRSKAFLYGLTQIGFTSIPRLGSYRTIILDLGRSLSDIRKGFDQKWRNQLNRSEKNDLTSESYDSVDAYDTFLSLYNEMLLIKQFNTTVDVNEFKIIQNTLPSSSRMRVFITRNKGRAIAALVIVLMGNTAVYLLGATNERARELKASYQLHWQVIQWLKERGALWYDLGGIDPIANPGGYHFKCGFGGIDVKQLEAYQMHGNMISWCASFAAILKHRYHCLHKPS